MYALRESLGDMAELECIRHCLLSLLFKDLFNIIIVVIFVYYYHYL